MNNMQLLNRKQVSERTGLSFTTLKRLEAAGKFPGRRQITERRVAWLESDIDSFIAECVALRDAAVV